MGGELQEAKQYVQRETSRDRVRVSTYSRVPTETERMFYADFIRRMANRRKDLGLTQAALDDRLNIAPGLIAKWEMMDRLPSQFMMVCWACELRVVLVPVSMEEQ